MQYAVKNLHGIQNAIFFWLIHAYAKNGDIALLQHSYSNAKSHEFGRTGPTDR